MLFVSSSPDWPESLIILEMNLGKLGYGMLVAMKSRPLPMLQDWDKLGAREKEAQKVFFLFADASQVH